MKCDDFFAKVSRCSRGIPVARLFRHYFCEGDHERCPLKKIEEEQRKRHAATWTKNPSAIGGEV